jgi:hypothetical protein
METPNYKMLIIISAITIGLGAVILILLAALWATAEWVFEDLLRLSQFVTVVGGMVLPGVVLVLNFLGQKKYANDQPKTKMFALINITIIGVTLVIAIIWLFATISLIDESYIGFYIGIIICIVGSIGMFAIGLILELQYLLKVKTSK